MAKLRRTKTLAPIVRRLLALEPEHRGYLWAFLEINKQMLGLELWETGYDLLFRITSCRSDQ